MGRQGGGWGVQRDTARRTQGGRCVNTSEGHHQRDADREKGDQTKMSQGRERDGQ